MKKKKTTEPLENSSEKKTTNENENENVVAKMIDTSTSAEEQCKLLCEECKSLRRQLAGIKGENTKLKAVVEHLKKLNFKYENDLAEINQEFYKVEKQRVSYLDELKKISNMPWYKKISYKYSII